ncbi:hypothetical protein A3K86_02485 [Photobacterium jeanii]|uniref:Amidinotransferase n=1 Tax=Photobacterium jeanii TaxID=858640 RepID=A0A178KL12_9GAMM|nr:hypothetical protein [Photobacterium jeanii]OAN17806.1 hypothetical protein A3K86_02485 [Photobacterium jeanii]PST92528.1 hypothetical protein C9I91_04985 [Photobacterium jeanii]
MTNSLNRRDFFKLSGGAAALAATATLAPTALASNGSKSSVDPTKRLHVTHEYGKLTEVIIGNPPAPDSKIPNYEDGFEHNMAPFLKPETAQWVRDNSGKTWLEAYGEETYTKLCDQIENYAKTLQDQGIKVIRLKQFNDKDGNYLNDSHDQIWPRDMWCTAGNTAMVSSLRMPFKRKQQYMGGEVYVPIMLAGQGNYVSAPQASLETFTDNVEVQELAEKNSILIDGGDFLVDGFNIYQGIGHGSNENAVAFAQQVLGDEYKVHGLKLHTNALHLDCAMSLLSPKLGLICRKWILSDLPKSLDGIEWIDVTEEEAFWLGTNGLPLDENTVIMDSRHERIIAEVRKRGHKVIEVPYDMPSSIGGALRCSSQPIRREPVTA